MGTRTPINIGDRVAYSATFLRSTGMTVGPYGFLRGVVKSIVLNKPGYRILSIAWDGHEGERMINEFNLTLVSRIGIDSALAT